MGENQMGTSGSALRAGRRIGAIATMVGVGASAAMLFGTGAANAVGSVPCTDGPVRSTVVVDCTDTDPTGATLYIVAYCSDLANIGEQARVMPGQSVHIVRNCSPAAHPVIWWVGTQTDGEEWQSEHDQHDHDHSHDDHHDHHDH